MKKTSFYLNMAASALFALGLCISFQSCAVADNSSENDDPEPVDNRIKTAEEFLAAVQKGGVVELAPNAQIALTEPVTLTQDVSIMGNDENPASLKLAGGFITDKSLNIDYVNIDASELTTPLISFPAAEEAPAEWVKIPIISLSNVLIWGLGQSLIYSGIKNYAVESFIIDNSLVEVVKDITVFDYTKGSVVLNQAFSKSTLRATLPTQKSMYSSQSGQKATEYAADATQTFSFLDCTVYNFAVGKNFFSHRQSNQKWMSYELKYNIFLDCGKKGQVVRGINGGQNGSNPTWSVIGNAFQFTVDNVITDSSADESTGDDNGPVTDSFNGVVKFGDVASGDFSQNSVSAGAPYWIRLL